MKLERDEALRRSALGAACRECFEVDQPPEILPYYLGRINGREKFAWLHQKCCAAWMEKWRAAGMPLGGKTGDNNVKKNMGESDGRTSAAESVAPAG